MLVNEEVLFQPAQVVRVGFMNGTWPMQEFVMEAIKSVTKYANLKILWNLYYGPDSPLYSSDVRIDFGAGSEKWKHLIVCAEGTDCFFYPQNKGTMRLNAVATYFQNIERMRLHAQQVADPSGSVFNNDLAGYSSEFIINTLIPNATRSIISQIKHEALHMLGIKHEQENPYANIPWKINMLTRLSKSKVVPIGYDKDSIMHYPDEQYQKWVAEGTILDNVDYNYELSKGDIEGIQLVYPADIAGRAHPSSWDTVISQPEYQRQILVIDTSGHDHDHDHSHA